MTDKDTVPTFGGATPGDPCIVLIYGKPCGKPQTDVHRHWNSTGCGETTWPWAHFYSATDPEWRTYGMDDDDGSASLAKPPRSGAPPSSPPKETP